MRRKHKDNKIIHEFIVYTLDNNRKKLSGLTGRGKKVRIRMHKGGKKGE